MNVTYRDYIFDSKDVWYKTISHPSYSLDMPFSKFMDLYKHFRDGTSLNVETNIIKKDSTITRKKEYNTASILNQDEIDALINNMSGSPSSDDKVSKSYDNGLLNQSDLDELFKNI